MHNIIKNLILKNKPKQITIGFMDWADELANQITDYIDLLIARDRNNVCKKCYGKGYSTEFCGKKYSADFVGDKSYKTPLGIKINICSCDRGKQIKKYFTIK